jgi:hypothetical protein
MKRIDIVKRQDGWAGESGGRTVRNTKAAAKSRSRGEEGVAASVGPEPQDGRDVSGGADLSAFRRSQEKQGLGLLLAGGGQRVNC